MNIFDHRYEMMPRARTGTAPARTPAGPAVRLKSNVRRNREKIGDRRVDPWPTWRTCRLQHRRTWWRVIRTACSPCPCAKSSGCSTTVGPQGKPLVIGHTRNGLAQWGRLVAPARGQRRDRQRCRPDVLWRRAFRRAGYLFGARSSKPRSSPRIRSMWISDRHPPPAKLPPTSSSPPPGNALDLVQVMEQRRLDPQSLTSARCSSPARWTGNARTPGRGLFAACMQSRLAEILDPGLCMECEAGIFTCMKTISCPKSIAATRVDHPQREALPLLRLPHPHPLRIEPGKCSCGRTGAILLRAPGGWPPPGQRTRSTKNSWLKCWPHQAAGRPFTVAVSERRIVFPLKYPTTVCRCRRLIEDPRAEIESEFLARLASRPTCGL